MITPQQPESACQQQLVGGFGLHPRLAPSAGTRTTSRQDEPSLTAATPDRSHHREHQLSSSTGRHEGAAEPAREPGQWPAACQRSTVGDATWARLEAERARREVFLGVVRADLEEQPSPHAVRAAARRWNASIIQLADDVATTKREAA